MQEALDLFDGKVVDVREAKPAKESRVNPSATPAS